MNIHDKVRLSDLASIIQGNKKIDPDLKDVLYLIMTRLDLFIQNLISQLRKEPTIFIVDPSTNLEDVEGAKTGDIAIFKNADGVVDIQRFD